MRKTYLIAISTALIASTAYAQSSSDLVARSGGSTWVDGDYVKLNCLERAGTGYHDDPERAGIEESESTPYTLSESWHSGRTQIQRMKLVP